MEGKATKSAIAGVILLGLGAALLVVAVGFLTFALNQWLRLGEWPDYPLSQMLAELKIPAPRLSRGQGALAWLLSLGACTAFFWAGALLALLGGAMLVADDKRRRLGQVSA